MYRMNLVIPKYFVGYFLKVIRMTTTDAIKIQMQL